MFIYNYIKSFFVKELDHILAPFDKMTQELRVYATRMEATAARKTARAHSLNSQAVSHLLDRDTALRIGKNIEGLL